MVEGCRVGEFGLNCAEFPLPATHPGEQSLVSGGKRRWLNLGIIAPGKLKVENLNEDHLKGRHRNIRIW